MIFLCLYCMDHQGFGTGLPQNVQSAKSPHWDKRKPDSHTIVVAISQTLQSQIIGSKD